MSEMKLYYLRRLKRIAKRLNETQNPTEFRVLVKAAKEIASNLRGQYSNDTHTDASNDDIDWITMENGEHVPLVGGVAIGGPMKGKNFSDAKSQKRSSHQSSGSSSSSASRANRPIVHGKDISTSYTGEGDIKSVMKAQGFDGLPKVVSKDEFDKAVKASNFIAQRTYAASDQETLDKYQDMLYNGEWYVECTEGGAQYGQGMYCAADYEGNLSDGIKAEMKHYASIGKNRWPVNWGEVRKMKAKEANKAYHDALNKGMDMMTEDQKLVFTLMDLTKKPSDKATDLACEILRKMNPDERAKFDALRTSTLTEAFNASYDIKYMPDDDYAASHGLGAKIATETLTLDPSSKIAKYRDLAKAYYGLPTEDWDTVMENAKKEGIKKIGEKYGAEVADAYATVVTGNQKMTVTEALKITESLGSNEMDDINSIYNNSRNSAENKFYKHQEKREKEGDAIREKFPDIGAYAASLGYDAINAGGHGKSGSYTVILNRTKTIFLDQGTKTDAFDADGDEQITFVPYEDGFIYALKGKEVVGWVKVFTVEKKANA